MLIVRFKEGECPERGDESGGASGASGSRGVTGVTGRSSSCSTGFFSRVVCPTLRWSAQEDEGLSVRRKVSVNALA